MLFHELGVARIAQPYMAVGGYGLAFRVFGIVGNVALFFHAQGCAAVFFAAENGLLLLQGRPVPKFDKMTDDAYGLIAAVFRPCRFVQTVGSHARPQYLVGDFRLADVGVGRTVAEA